MMCDDIVYSDAILFTVCMVVALIVAYMVGRMSND